MSSRFNGLDLLGPAADNARSAAVAFAAEPANAPVIKQALRVRAVETALLDLFGRGKLHGTIHTCVGQELTGVLIGRALAEGDFVTSNHRCHGHFIGATGNWRGLIDEIVGNADGVCAGIGSSQHLWAPNFISNGQQGGLLPVAAGIALDRKRAAKNNVVVSFIGEGTLGEGTVYETMNLDALWGLPHVIVCENNFYSQSTPQKASVAGEIALRARPFGIDVRQSSTWSPAELGETLAKAIGDARARQVPVFVVVKTYRLNPHSKGDDQRSAGELAWFHERDPLNIILATHNAYRQQHEAVAGEVKAYAEAALAKPKLTADRYVRTQLPAGGSGKWRAAAPPPPDDQRVAQRLNAVYGDWLAGNARAYFIGEDIDDPYGGAFKISKGLQTRFPERVLTTPISEAAITGVGIGLALAGNRPLVEIMFGDFMTLTFDQIVNNAAKFFHMYNGNASCPVVVRTPMGGRRGYGPTHSQSLERFFVGIDNCTTISVNAVIDAAPQLAGLGGLAGPALVFENKVDYTLRPYKPPAGFVVEHDDAPFPTARVRPEGGGSTVTVVAYGGMARLVADHLLDIFDATDLVPELIVPTAIHPLDIMPIAASAAATGRIAIIEEGAGFASPGAEIAAQVAERLGGAVRIVRVSGWPVPVPSVPALENEALPGIARICEALATFNESSAHGRSS